MRIYLFAAVLGCIVVCGLAQRDVFQFTDSHGRCWSCSPGTPCSPCQRNSNSINGFFDPNFPTECPATIDCLTIASPTSLFPDQDPRFWLECGATSSIPFRMQCQPDTFFSYFNQRCDFTWQWLPWCSNYPNPLPEPFPPPPPTVPIDPPTPPPGPPPTVPVEPPTIPPPTLPPPGGPPPTVPNENNPPTVPIQTPPTAPTEAPPPPTGIPDPTAQPPCSCIPWFPCWCNPCMNMPCGKCNGCWG